MDFFPEDIEKIIVDYKKQFERKYNCSIKHTDNFFESFKKNNITFYKNPYKFKCNLCDYTICDNHSDEFVKKHTKDNLCNHCNFTEKQSKILLKDINIRELNIEIRAYKSILFFFKNEDLENANILLKNRYKEIGDLNTDDLYEIIDNIYNRLTFFDFFEEEI